MAAAYAREGGYGAPASVIHIDSAHPDHAIIVPDAQLLFTGDFHRAGPDLVIIGHDGRHHIIPDYFASEQRPALAAPNGASLPPNVIDLLAGSPTPNEYAQAGAPAASADPIGTVEKVVGSVTVVRNGVAVALHVGDKVYQSDVIQTGSDSQAGIGFPDGTALNLVANTRMALNEYSYDPNSNSNSALISLVEGTFSFVAGKVAHTGDMKIQTPVATMGIRGTTGWVQDLATVTANYNNNTYSFAVSPDYGTNQTGMYDLIDQNGNVIATVSQSGFLTLVTPQGVGVSPVVTTQPMTPTQLQFEQQIVQEVFQTLNLINNPNPHSTPGSGSSGGGNQQNGPAQQLLKENGGSLNLNTPGENNSGSGSGQSGSGNGQNLPTPTAYWLYDHDGNWGDPLSWSDAWAPLYWQNLIINQPVTVTIDASDAGSFASGLLVGLEAILAIISGGSLTVTNIVDVFGTIDVNSNIQDPTFTAQGPVTVEALGTIEAIGSAAAVYFSDATGITVTDVAGNPTSYTIDNSGTIRAGQSGQVFFEQAIINNESTGLIVAQSHGSITFDGGLVNGVQSSLQNSGTVEAIDGGAVVFDLGMLVDNTGTISAGAGAVAGGTLTFDAATLTNEATGLIEAQNGGTLTIQTGNVVGNLGTLEAISGGLLTIYDNVDNTGQLLIADGGTMALVNDTVTGGQINLSSTGTASELQIGGIVTFTGGTVTLSDNAQNAILSNGTAATLINYDGISGAGAIGHGDALFTLINEQGSTIDATGTIALIIDNDSPAVGNFALNEIVNSGTIEATGSGGLTIENTTIDNSTYDPTTGTGVDGQIEALSGSHIDLDNATILQGFVTVDARGELDTVSGSANEIETANGPTHNTAVASISIAGTISISDDSSLILASPYDIENSGNINLNSTGHQAILYFDQPAPILSGGGNITLEGGEGSQDIIAGLIGQGYTTVLLDNQNNTISGAGAIGQDDGQLTLQNDALGTIDANISGETLTIDTGSGVIDTNAGLLEATNGGTLALVNSTLTNSGSGTIAVDHLAALSLTGIDTITGGGTLTNSGAISAAGAVSIGHETLINSATGAIFVGTTGGAADTLTLTSTTVTNSGSITVDDNALLLLNGGDTVTGAGSITVDSGGMLSLSGADTISGVTLTVESGGEVTIASGASVTFDNVVVTDDATSQTPPGIDVASGAVLTLQDSTSISGSGTGTLAVEAGAQLLIATPSGATLNGIIVDDDGTGSSAGAGGAGIYVSGAVLTLDGGTQIEGGAAAAGTLQIDRAGQLKITGAATLDSVTVTDGNLGGAGIDVSGAVLTLDDGTLISGGTLTVESASGSQLLVTAGPGSASDGATAGGATLDAVSVADNSTSTANPGIEVASGAVLTLDGGTAITGVPGATMTLAGILEVDNGSDSISNVTVTDVGTNTNPAQLVVSGGTLTLNNDLFNGGAIEITVDAGASLVLNSTDITDAILDTKAGSTLTVPGNSLIETINSTFAGTNTVGTGVTLTLTDESVTGTIKNQGILEVETAGVYPDGAIFDGVIVTNIGTSPNGGIEVGETSAATLVLEDGALISGGYLNVESGGHLSITSVSGATLDNVVVDDDTTSFSPPGIDVASGAALTLDAGTQIWGGGNGTLTIEAGGQLSITTASGATLDGLLVHDDSTTDGIDVASGAVLTLNDGTVVSGGTLTVENTGELLIAVGSGRDAATGRGATLDNVAVTDHGALDIGDANSGAVLTLDGGMTMLGGGTGTLTINAGNTLDVEGSSASGYGAAIGGVEITDHGALDVGEVNSGSTLILYDGTTVDGDGTGTLTIGAGDTLDVEGVIGATLDNVAVTDSGALDIGDVNSGAVLTLDGGMTMLGGGTGTLTINAATSLDIEKGSSGAGATLDDVSVTNDNAITVGATATGTVLTLDDGTKITNGSGDTITISSGSTLTLSGATISGGIIDDGTLASGATITVSGSSTIENGTLDNGDVSVVGSGTVLTLTDETVSGSTITLASGGSLVVDPTVTLEGGATITGGSITNTGVLEIAGPATLSNDTLTNGGATLKVDASETLTISGDTIGGGTLTIAGNGSTAGDIDITGNTKIDGNATINGGDLTLATGVTLTLDDVTRENSTLIVNGNSTIRIDSGDTLTDAGTDAVTGSGALTISNSGTFAHTGTLTNSLLNTTFTGSGTVIYDGGNHGVPGQTLTNEGNTFTGHQQFGNGTVAATIDNASGTFDADGSGNAFVFESGVVLSNGGTMEATGGGALTFFDDVSNTGAIIAGAGSSIDIDHTGTNLGAISNATAATVTVSGALQLAGGTISGGTVTNSGSITTTTAGGAIDNATIDNSSGAITAGGKLTLDDTTVNGGTLTGNSASSVFAVDHGDTLTLNGVTALGTSAVGELSNSGTVTLENGLTISGTSFTLELTGAGTVSVNSETIAGLAAGDVFENKGNTIDVTGTSQIGDGTTSYLTLDNAAGKIDVQSGTLTLDTANPITNAGGVTVASGATLQIDDGTVSNSGTITVDGTLALDGNISLTSGGTVSMGGGMIAPVMSGETLTNDITIAGTGQIGTGSGVGIALNLVNAGVIEANVNGGTLKIENFGSFSNTGTLEATNGGTLQVHVGAIANTGTIAVDTGSAFQLDNPTNFGATVTFSGDGQVTLSGGTIKGVTGVSFETLLNDGNTIFSSGLSQIGSGTAAPIIVDNASGIVDVTGGTLTIKTDEPVTNAGLIEVATGATLDFTVGLLDNSGTNPTAPTNPGGVLIDGTFLADNPLGSPAAGNVHLGYAGDVVLQGGTITATISGETLQNQGNTISGYGLIGSTTNSNLALHNLSGTVDATGGTLTIDSGSNTIINTGTLEASNGGTLHLESAVDNSGGTVQALDGEIDVAHAGSDDMITASGGTVVITDDSLGNIAGSAFGAGATVSATGGTLTIENGSSFGSGANISTGGSGTILTVNDSTFGDGANVHATDGSSLLVESSTFGDGVTVDASGGSSLTIDDGASFSAGDSVSLTSGSVTIDGTSIDGYGTLSGHLGTDVASVTADGGTLDITGLTTGPVSATVDSGDALTVGAANDIVTFNTVANAGTIEVAAGTLDVTGAVSGGGTTQIDAGATFQIGSTDADPVTFNGTGGTFVIDNAALTDANHYTGTIGDGVAGDFVSGDTIDLKDVSYTLGTETDVWSQGANGGTLTIYSGTTAEASINLAGSYNQNDFELVSDGGSGALGNPGTEVVWNPSATTSQTASFTSGSISFENGHWVENDGIVTLSGIDQVTITGGPSAGTYLLVDNVGAGGYGTIQDAVNAATSSGDTILIAPGTYQEQVSVTNSAASGLTIEGANGAGTVTVEAPTAPGSLEQTAVSPTSGNAIDGIFTVDGVSNVAISGLSINGLNEGDETYFAPGQAVGSAPGAEGPSLIGVAYVNADGGTISGDTITGTQEDPANIGDQRNFGIFVVNNNTLAGDVPTSGEAAALNTITISNSNLFGFQKGGIVVEYADATISGNMLTGAGDVDTAQNAIEVRESTGTVSDNIISNIGYSGTDAAATGVLAFDNYGLDIAGNQFTGALGPGNTLLVSPVGVYVLDSTNGEIENNSAANVDDGVVVLSNGFGAGDDILGSWTVTGNTTTNVVPAADGGDSIYFDPDPTSAGQTFVATGGANDVGDVFFVSAGTDTLTGGGGGGNAFVVLAGSDLSNADTINGGGSGNTIYFASGTSADTLVIGSNVTGIQEVDVVGSTFAQTDATPLNVNASAAVNSLTITANDGGDTITGTAAYDDTLIGGTGNDTFIVGTGNDSITGGGGHDTVQYDAALTASDITVVSGTEWQVSDGTDGTDTLTGIQRVTDGTHNFLLVGDGAYSDVTAASTPGAASSGDTLIVDSGTDPSVQTVSTDNLTIDALSGSTALNLQLGSGVQTLTLADYAPGQGANVVVNGNGAGDSITGNDGNDTLTGGAGNDTFVLGTGTNTVAGGGGVDTVDVGAGYSLAIQSGQWVVTNGTVTDTLSGIDKVDIAGTTYDLVDKFGAGGGFQSLQAAIDASHSGDTILVAPGSYTETANYNAAGGTYGSDSGTNPVGLLVDQSVTIEGVDASGNVITSASGTQATIVSSVESDWGTNFYVTADNVTITGLTLQATDNGTGEVNKAVEVVGNNFTMENSLVDATSGVPLGSSIYVDELTVPGNLTGFVGHITGFDIANNILTGDFVEANGVGYGDATTNLQLTDNEFSLNAGTTAAAYGGNIGVILDGQVDLAPESAWLLAPVVAPDITGNTFDTNYTADPYGARFLAWDDSAANLPNATYIENYVANNDLGTYAYALASGAPDYSTYNGTSYYYIYLNAGDASASGDANPGDTIVVESNGDSSVQTVGTNDLTIDALAGSNGLDLLLGSGVTEITLADYDTVSHLGANVTVTGNGEGDTIIANDGNDVLDPGDASGPSTLTGGAGNDTFVYGAGYGAVTITNFDQGSGSFVQSKDTIDLTKETGVHSFSELQSDATQNGSNTVITFTSGDILTLDNVTPSQIEAGDFTFAPGPTEPFTWATEASGSWTVASNWNDNGFYPGQSGNADQVEITTTSGIIVTYDTTATIESLTTNSDATLDITGGSLTITSDTANLSGPVENAGTLDVANGSVNLADNSGLVEVTDGTLLLTGDNIDNASGGNGYIAAYDGSTLQLAAGVTVTDGTITIGTSSDTTDQLLIGSGDGDTLQNLNVNNFGTVLIDSGATLTLDGSAIFGGTVTDNGTNGALDTNGNSAINNAQVDVQVRVTAGTLTLNDVTFAGGTIANSGTINATGTDKILASVDNEGTITAESGTTLNLAAAVTGGGSIVIDTGGTVEIGAYNTEAVNFAGAGTLQINTSSANFTGTVENYGPEDTIDLAGVTYSSTNETDVWSQNGSIGTLAIYAGATLDYSINLAGTYAQSDFALIGDSGGGTSGGTDVIWNPPAISAPEVGSTASDFVTIDDPGTLHSTANGINDSGVIVGSAALDVNNDTGWEYNGGFSAIAVAGAQDSDVNNINNLGEVAGLYSPVRSTPRYGFVDDNGTYTQINVSPGISTTASVNDAGVVVGGSYLHTVGSVEPVYTGFIDNNGTITYLNAPGTLNSDGYTYASGINDADQVVGTAMTTYGGLEQGFLYQNGTFTFINDPDAGTQSGQGTDAVAINNSGVIVGFYYDNSSKLNGFVDIGGVFTTVDDPLGVKGTQILGINDAGQIVGTYLDSSNVSHGFVASLNGETTNEDAALVLNSLSVSAADAGNNPIQVTLDVSHGTLTLSTESGVTEVGLGTADVTLTGSQSAIDTALAAGLTYTPTLDYHYADVLAVSVDDEGHNVSHVAQTTTQDVGIIITPADTVAANATFTVVGASSDTIAFAGTNGTIVFDDPSGFTGHIADISGSGDVIDLGGLTTADTATTGNGSFNPVTDTTLLTVTDSSSNVLDTINLAGDYSNSHWTVTSDNNGGVNIADPPASSGNEPAVLSTATADGASGTISFADTDPASAISASFTPDGANDTGSFTLDQPTESNGIVSVGFEFNDGQVNLSSGQTLTESYNVTVADAQNPAENTAQTVSVTIGGPGNDNFVFAPGIGADTVTNFNALQDTLELDHFANVQTAQELQALITTDAHGDAVINLGHNDSVTLAGVTDAQLQHIIQAGHVLLH